MGAEFCEVCGVEIVCGDLCNDCDCKHGSEKVYTPIFADGEEVL
ncbi:hypothetical protein [Bacillus dicomae]|nr:hypothetical protein [Bacillus dicomae]